MSHTHRAKLRSSGGGSFGGFFDRSGYAARVMSAKLLKKVWLDEADRRRALTYAYHSTICGKVLKVDHTFWSTKFVREDAARLCNAQVRVMTSEGVELQTLTYPRTAGRSERDWPSGCHCVHNKQEYGGPCRGGNVVAYPFTIQVLTRRLLDPV